MNQGFVDIILIFLHQEWNTLFNDSFWGVSIYILSEKCNIQIKFPYVTIWLIFAHVIMEIQVVQVAAPL